MSEGENTEHNSEEKRPAEREGSAAAEGSARAEAQKSPLEAEIESPRESLQISLAEEKGKAEDYLKHWQRTQADFVNYKRRVDQERAEQARFANATLILKVLPILDDFERAFASLPHEMAGFTWLEGMGLIDRKLRFVLEQEGVTPIEAIGKDFDPQLHEAVLFEEGADAQHSVVVAELQKGYKLHDRVIRPTLVKVGQPTREASANEASANEAGGNEPEGDIEEPNGGEPGAAD